MRPDSIRAKIEGLQERNQERQAKRLECLSRHLNRQSRGQARRYETVPKKRDRFPKELTAQERWMNQRAEISLDRKERGINQERDDHILMPEPPLPRNPLE
jgi:hypothetical protein